MDTNSVLHATSAIRPIFCAPYLPLNITCDQGNFFLIFSLHLYMACDPQFYCKVVYPKCKPQIFVPQIEYFSPLISVFSSFSNTQLKILFPICKLHEKLRKLSNTLSCHVVQRSGSYAIKNSNRLLNSLTENGILGRFNLLKGMVSQFNQMFQFQRSKK